MAPKEVVKQLRRLSKREREILQLRCEAIEIAECSNQLHLSDSTVKTYIGRIYLKFDLDQHTEFQRWKALFQVYCPVLKEIDLPPARDERGEPDPIPPLIMRKVEDDEELLYKIKQVGVVSLFEEDDMQLSPPPNTKLLRWVTVILLALLCILVIADLFSRFSGTTVGALETPTPSIFIVPTADRTDTPEPNIPTLAPARETVVVPQTVVVPETVVVPQTVITIATPTPVPAPPTPNSAILFEDDFTNGVKPEWNMKGTNFTAVDGTLSSQGLLEGYVGDKNWGNYIVDFDVLSAVPSKSEAGLRVQIRRQDNSNYMTLHIGNFGLCRFIWTKTINGKETPIVNTDLHARGAQRRMKIWYHHLRRPASRSLPLWCRVSATQTDLDAGWHSALWYPAAAGKHAP